MKYCVYIFLTLLAISCNDEQNPPDTENKSTDTAVAAVKAESSKAVVWKGMIDKNVPVSLNYQTDSNIIVGEILYLNTKEQKPIKIIGTIDENKEFRIMEFENSGNITGVITGKTNDGMISGTWLSPKTMKSLSLELTQVDTNMVLTELKSVADEPWGKYHYEYGKDGYSGTLDVAKAGADKIIFSISAVTSAERGNNLADVSADTVQLNGASFIYEIPGSDNCEFKVKFYKDFTYIHYTKGYCTGQFGHNATIEGIFLKMK